MPMWNAIRAEFIALLDLLLPPACPLCRTETPGLLHGRLCAECLADIPPLASPRCPRCALPYPAPDGSDHLCEECLRKEPPFDAVAAAGVYGAALRRAVHRFKYEGAVDLDRPLSTLLADSLRRSLPDFVPDLIVPVPLHRSRLRERTYNQALLLARGVGRQTGVKVAPRLLQRIRSTPTQQGLSSQQRRQNLRGAFTLRNALDGESILLIDDVLTTGVTARECSRVLLEGGAGQVAVGVLARAPRHLL
jgi:ComF family protein